MTARLPDWRQRLQAAVDPYYGQAFAWGKRDCALFAADGVLAILGIDLAARFRGRYATRQQSRALLAKLGYDSHVDVFAEALTEVYPSMTIAGDLATVTSKFGPAMGIVLGERIAVMGPRGFGTVPLADAKRAFKVGD